MHKFEIIEHTADVGLRVYGETREELFLNSAWGLFALLVDDLPKAKEARTVEVEAPLLEDLLVDWLNELISLFFTDKFLPKELELKLSGEEGNYRLFAEMTGGQYDPYTHQINNEIKAATSHNLKIEEKEEPFEAQIIFDV